MFEVYGCFFDRYKKNTLFCHVCIIYIHFQVQWKQEDGTRQIIVETRLGWYCILFLCPCAYVRIVNLTPAIFYCFWYWKREKSHPIQAPGIYQYWGLILANHKLKKDILNVWKLRTSQYILIKSGLDWIELNKIALVFIYFFIKTKKISPYLAL